MRYFVIKTNRLRLKNITVLKKLCRKPRFRRIFFKMPKISLFFQFGHFSAKAKNLTCAGVIFVFVLSLISAVAITKQKNEVVAVFGHSNSNKIINEVLPTTQEPYSISELKKHITNSINKTPKDIVKSFGGIFENLKSPTPPPEIESPTITPSPPAEQKTIISKNLFKNETSYNLEMSNFENMPLKFSDNPEILIIHTHTTESYTPEEFTTAPDSGRSTDETKNMLAIGTLIKTELEKSGLRVIHDKTFHDYPSYQGAYGRSLATAQKQLSKNHNIQIVLDIHRDAIVNADGSKIKTVKTINNIPCAQIMLVCGTDGGGLSHPEWKNNLNFAIKLQEKAEAKYPGLMRPINVRNERFNQHLTKGSLIIEIGTHGNNLTEAKNGALLIADVIAELIN